MTDAEVRRRVEELESLLEHVDGTPAHAIEALLALYGEALRRILDVVATVPHCADALRRDELVSHLLVLHDLDAAASETFVSLL